jgi:hypothetical protein
MTDYIDPADLPDGEHLALVRWSGGVDSSRFVNRNGFRIAGFPPVTAWEHSSARIVTLLHRADECPGAGGWEPADLGPELAGQIVRVETPSGAVEGVAMCGEVAWPLGVHIGAAGYQWFEPEWVVRVFTRPDPHAGLIEQLRDLLGSLPEGEIERVVMRAKAAKPGGAS